MEFPALKVDLESLRQQCDDPYTCAHPQKELRRKLDKLGGSRLHYQCLRCGQPVGVRVSAKGHTADQIEGLHLFDEEFRAQVWAGFRARFEARQHAERMRLRVVWEECYARYLKSSEWKERRDLVMLRAQGICEGCRRRKATEVHHTTYENVGEELLFQLVAVCRECHDRLHASILPRFLEDLRIHGYSHAHEEEG